MTYTVQVIPISFSNKDGRNDIGTLKTKERTILSYHVEPIRALSVKARSLQLSTQLLSENNNNCFLVSVRFSCSKVVDGEVDPESQYGGSSPRIEYRRIVLKLPLNGSSKIPESPSALMLSGDRESIVVAWKAPTVKNGVVVRYRIHVRMVEPMYPIPKICEPFEEYNETVDLRDEVEPEESRSWDGAEFEYTISRLNPFTLYTVQIAAATGAGVGSYTEPKDVITLPSVPEAVQNFVIEEIEGPELDQAYRSAVKLSWQLPCRLHGNLARFVGRLYGTRGENGSPPHELTWNVEVQADEINDTYLYVEDRLKPEYNYTVSMSVEVADVAEQSPETTLSFLSLAGNWHGVINTPCVKQYQTTPVRWNPMTTASRSDDPIEYVIGREQCNEEKCHGEECNDKNQYCNGPLKPGTEYALVVRVFSRSAYSDSPFRSFRTDSLIQVGLIISTVVASLLLAFIGGLLVLWRKQRLLLPTQLSGRTPTEEPSDIPLKNFPNQYDELFQSNREKVGKEFQAINYFCDTVLVETVTFFSARENERKNRYVNILPFDSNRVLLDSEENEELNANDYINASFVEGYKYQREYIATQGPKENTCYDFWRMVLQYEIESIVMLTQPIDHDKNKCCQYYPRFNQTVQYGDIQVKCTQEMNLSLYYKRLFLVSKGIQSKAVFHYHFLDWPDHSCPASPADLIKFSKIIRTERKSYAIPLVVHCSAGVGRTGTFIALDILLQRMQQEKKINVYDTVKRLRRQRVKMVQTLDQYAFLYQCCLEFVSKLNRKKPKTSNVEAIEQAETEKRRPDIIMEVEKVTVGNGGKPMFNIKFPKSVNPGLGAVTSFAPSDIESGKW
ncbi:AGAP011650-PA-like protein [Anopheles sinensis]|uniref:AGAP011650-PA-like protein n=1 Tax=Anopheles sinensis TaxID=74873 RepID=A0A084VIA5_ANOSI|nr:AGAP011650-PA-like protein [Anopheles sinensis]